MLCQVANHPWLRGDVPEATPMRHKLISVSATELSEAVSVTLRPATTDDAGKDSEGAQKANRRESVELRSEMSAAEEQLRTQIFMSKSDALSSGFKTNPKNHAQWSGSDSDSDGDFEVERVGTPASVQCGDRLSLGGKLDWSKTDTEGAGAKQDSASIAGNLNGNDKRKGGALKLSLEISSSDEEEDELSSYGLELTKDSGLTTKHETKEGSTAPEPPEARVSACSSVTSGADCRNDVLRVVSAWDSIMGRRDTQVRSLHVFRDTKEILFAFRRIVASRFQISEPSSSPDSRTSRSWV